jgi:hypothetical protein
MTDTISVGAVDKKRHMARMPPPNSRPVWLVVRTMAVIAESWRISVPDGTVITEDNWRLYFDLDDDKAFIAEQSIEEFGGRDFVRVTDMIPMLMEESDDRTT